MTAPSTEEEPPMNKPLPPAAAGSLRERLIEDMSLRGFSEKTQRYYIRIVSRFAAFLGCSPDTATPEDIRRWQLHLSQLGTNPPAFNSTVAALRFFFTVTLDRPDLSRKLVRLAYPRKLPRVLSPEEVARLAGGDHLPQAPCGPGSGLWRRPAGRRGRRTQGWRHRQPAHADPRRARQGRAFPPGHAIARSARPAAWWQEGHQQAVMLPGGWLFPGQNPLNPITTRQLFRVVQEAAHAAGIARRVGPHTLRHSFATHLLEDGVDIRVIQALLGHAKLDNTALYTRVATRTVRTVTSPLDKIAALIGGSAEASG
jgi:site-specific recombinase XerD